MKRTKRKMIDFGSSLNKSAKRMLAVLMSTLMLLGMLPQYVPAATKGGQSSEATLTSMAPSSVASVIQPASIALTDKLS